MRRRMRGGKARLEPTHGRYAKGAIEGRCEVGAEPRAINQLVDTADSRQKQQAPPERGQSGRGIRQFTQIWNKFVFGVAFSS